MPNANTKAKKMICVTTGIATVGGLFGIAAYNRDRISKFFEKQNKAYFDKVNSMMGTFENSIVLQVARFLLVSGCTIIYPYQLFKSSKYFYRTVIESNKCCNIVRCAARTTVMVPIYIVLSLLMPMISYMYFRDIYALMKENELE